MNNFELLERVNGSWELRKARILHRTKKGKHHMCLLSSVSQQASADTLSTDSLGESTNSLVSHRVTGQSEEKGSI